MNETAFETIDFVDQAELIEHVLQRAVHRALSIHKRLGNPVALWTNGELTVVPPDEIDLHILGDEGLGLDDPELPEYFGDLLQYVHSVRETFPSVSIELPNPIA